MKIRIVVDANILFSALLGGKPRFVLFDPKFQFVTARFTLKEVEKHIPEISKKSGISLKEIKEAISLFPLEVLSKDYYRDYLVKAEKLIGKIDPDDVDILALYLKEKTFLWSEDKDFEKVRPKINLVKTEDLI